MHGLIMLVQQLLQNIVLTSQKMNKWCMHMCIVFTKAFNKCKRVKMMFKIHFGPTMPGPTKGKKAKGLVDIPASSFSFSFDTLSLSFDKGIKVSRNYKKVTKNSLLCLLWILSYQFLSIIVGF